MDNLPPSLQTAIIELLLFLPDLITAIVVFVVTLVVAGMARNSVRKMLEDRGTNAQVSALLAKMARGTVLILGVLTALELVNFDVTAFIAGLGVLGFAAGFALQDVMSNFVAGILLLVQQPFKNGDLVDTAGFLGTIEGIDLRTTHLKTLDGQDVLIPNSAVLGNPITNLAMSNPKRIGVDVGVAYDSDLDLVRETAVAAVQAAPALLPAPAPMVLYHTFGGSSIDLTVYFWIDASKIHPLEAKDAGMTLVKAAFDKANIDIPFPIRTVYMNQ